MCRTSWQFYPSQRHEPDDAKHPASDCAWQSCEPTRNAARSVYSAPATAEFSGLRTSPTDVPLVEDVARRQRMRPDGL